MKKLFALLFAYAACVNVQLAYADYCIEYMDLSTANCYVNNSAPQNALTFNDFRLVTPVDSGASSMSSRHTVHMDPEETEPRTGNMAKTVPNKESGSVRLGNWDSENEAERIEYSIVVDTSAYPIFLLKYLPILEAPGHDNSENPHFKMELLLNGQPLGTCAYLDVSGNDVYQYGGLKPGAEEQGWHITAPSVAMTSADVLWKDWTSVGVNLRNPAYEGQTLTVRLTTHDCIFSAHCGYAYFTLNCIDDKVWSYWERNDHVFGAPDGFAYRWAKASNEQYRRPDGSMPEQYVVCNNQKFYTEDTARYVVDCISLLDSTCFFSLYAQLEHNNLEPCLIASGTCGAQGDNLTWELSCDGVLTISGMGAMADYEYNTAPWYENKDYIRTLIIENGVTYIGENAFYICDSLTYVEIPGSVTSFGRNIFRTCSGITSINVDSNNPNYGSIDGVLFNKEKTILIQYPRGRAGSYTIPNTVTSIGEGAFSGCYSLTSVTIPNSVTSIPIKAFSGCTNLTSINIPNSVTSIGKDAFNGCYGLTSVTIPNGVTSIGEFAFSCCGLTSIEIPSSVASIGQFVFSKCTGLTAINVSTSNPYYCSIDGILFNKDTTTLVECPERRQGVYTIPNSVISIVAGAFTCCKSLTSIEIPNTVTSIGEQAFDGCTGLTSMTCKAVTPPTLGEKAFGEENLSIPLYVPAESVELYRAARGWNRFSNILPIVELDPEQPNNPTGQSAEVTSTEGREFFVAWLPNGGSDPQSQDLKLQLIASSRKANTIVVEYANGLTTTYPIVAGQTVVIEDIDPQLVYWDPAAGEEEMILQKGIRVYSQNDEKFTLYSTNQIGSLGSYSFDGAHIIPVEALGTEYMVQSADGDAIATEFVIVSTKPGVTHVTMDLKVNSRKSGTQHLEVTLTGSKQIYIVRSKAPNPENSNDIIDLSGSTICADQPIAVWSGNQYAIVPNLNGLTVNHAYDQLLPLNKWGKTFMVPLTAANTQLNIMRIVAQQDGTEVSLLRGTNTPTTQMLNSGETFTQRMVQSINNTNPQNFTWYVTATKPIQVYVYSSSAGINNWYDDDGDNHMPSNPSMTLIPPLEFMTDTTIFSTFNGGEGSLVHMLNLIAHSSQISRIRLDGATVTGWKTIPSNNAYSQLTCEITEGTHTITAPDKCFTGYAFGIAEGEAYLYPLGYDFAQKKDSLFWKDDEGQYHFVDSIFINDNQTLNFPVNTHTAWEKVRWEIEGSIQGMSYFTPEEQLSTNVPQPELEHQFHLLPIEQNQDPFEDFEVRAILFHKPIICDIPEDQWAKDTLNTIVRARRQYNDTTWNQSATDLPYECSFEENEDLTPWVLNAGSPTSRDKWIYGTAEHRIGHRSLYVSSDGLNTTYTRQKTVLVSYLRYKFPTTTSGTEYYEVNFDWKGTGDGDQSCLYVMVCPEDELTKSNSAYNLNALVNASNAQLSNKQWNACQNLILGDSVAKYLSGGTAWQNVSLAKSVGVTSANSAKNFVFLFIWINQNSWTTDTIGYSSIAIDNFQISTNQIVKPGNVQVYPHCDDATLLVTWESNQQEFDIQYRQVGNLDWAHGVQGINDYTPGFVRTNGNQCSFSIPNIPEGSYEVRIRSSYYDDTTNKTYHSNYASVSQILMDCPPIVCQPYYNEDTLRLCALDSMLWHDRMIRHSGRIATTELDGHGYIETHVEEDTMYIDSYITEGGCDSIYTLHVHFSPSYFTAIEDTLEWDAPCEICGQLVQTSPNTYDGYISHITREGCDSLQFWHIAIAPRPQYTISLAANNTKYGSVDGADTFPKDTMVLIWATPNKGYQFNQWSDGNTDNPRLVTVTGDSTFTAIFGAKMCSWEVESNDLEMGAVVTTFNEPYYSYGTQITVEASPNSGYKFVKWNDGKKYNPYRFSLLDDKYLLAIFMAEEEEQDTTTVQPTTTTATFTWPFIDGGYTYSLTIYLDAACTIPFCTLTFNQDGILVAIRFGTNAPRRNLQEEGFTYTVSGLDANTTYYFKMETMDEDDKLINTDEGAFRTTGNATEVETLKADEIVPYKVLRNGQILILRGDRTYTLTGAETK